MNQKASDYESKLVFYLYPTDGAVFTVKAETWMKEEEKVEEKMWICIMRFYKEWLSLNSVRKMVLKSKLKFDMPRKYWRGRNRYNRIPPKAHYKWRKRPEPLA